MRLILIRHGETPSNVRGSLDTSLPGPGLTDLGQEQAEAIPDALRETLGEQRIDGIWTSLALRAQLTAAPLARSVALPPVDLPGAHEIQAGSYEKSCDPASVQGYLDTVGAWTQGELMRRMPGGETGEEVLARMDAAVARIAGSGAGTAVLVSHGALIRAWTSIRSGNLAPGFARHNRLRNTGVVVVEGDPDGGWVLTSWMGQAIGGPGVDGGDPYDGPAGHPVPERQPGTIGY